MNFNPTPPNIIHVDINSCFATIEQQANPHLRGKPIAVAAYTTNRGCILAASIEAKKLGIKTGMMVGEARKIYPKLIVLPPDPDKYRFIHKKLYKLLTGYSSEVIPKSIDEFVFTLHRKVTPYCVAIEIKQRIKKEIGEWITVSIGIGPNRYLAKIAAGRQKPDGLVEINKDNFLEIYSKMNLTDLTGIKNANASRLNSVGIYTVLDFYNYNKPILGCYWNLRLRGYEVDDFKSKRGTFGNSVAIGTNLSKVSELSPILSRLTEKMCSRLRANGYNASGIHLAIQYKNGEFWHKGRKTDDLYKGAFRLLLEANPKSPVLNIAVSSFNLSKNNYLQLGFFEDLEKKENLFKSIDKVNNVYGDFVITRGRAFSAKDVIKDRISFHQL